MRQNDFTLKCNLPRLPGESDCGSLYLETSHNHNYHKITSQNVHEIEKINEKRKHRAESRTKNTNSQKKNWWTYAIIEIEAQTLLPTVDISNTREGHNLQQVRPPISREPVYVHNSSVFDKDT